MFIASNSPKYMEMIVDSVDELDALDLWDSWDNGLMKQEEPEISKLGFGKKVYYMAKSKGDKGILPFLESLGVKLSSAKVIISYLQSDTLPNLLDKVLVCSSFYFLFLLNSLEYLDYFFLLEKVISRRGDDLRFNCTINSL